MVALLAVRLAVPLTLADGALADAPDGRDRHGHGDLRPPQRDAAHPRGRGGAGRGRRPLSDISRRLYRTKPEAQLRLFGRVLDRLQATPDGRVAWSTLRLEDLAATGRHPGPLGGDHRPPRPGRGRRGRDAAQGAGGRHDAPSVRTKPGGVDATVLTGTFGGGGHARASGATIPLPLDEAVAGSAPSPSGLAAAVRR